METFSLHTSSHEKPFVLFCGSSLIFISLRKKRNDSRKDYRVRREGESTNGGVSTTAARKALTPNHLQPLVKRGLRLSKKLLAKNSMEEQRPIAQHHRGVGALVDAGINYFGERLCPMGGAGSASVGRSGSES